MRKLAGIAVLGWAVAAVLSPSATAVPATPAAPSGLTATAVSSSRIDLAWVDNANDEDFFKLQRRRDGGAWVGIFLPGDTTSHEDSGLAAGTYCYRVRSHNGSGFSDYALSAPQCLTVLGGGGAPPPEGPAPPSALVASKISESRIDLSWTDNASDEKGFKMQRMIDGGAWGAIWHTRDTTSYVDTGLAAGTYCYRIRSYSDDGFSTYVLSTPNCLTVAGGSGPPPPSGPGAPSNLAIVAVSGDDVSLTWTDNATDEKGFKMQRRPPGGTWLGIWHPRDTTSYTDTDLSPGTYCYRIRSFNDAGHSSYTTSTPNCIVVGGAGTLSVETVVSVGLVQPIFLTAPFGDERLFIIERPGRIRIVKNGELLAVPFLDVTGLTEVVGEGGLLGLAFAFDYETSGLFYLNYTSPGVGQTVIARYRVSANPDIADASSAEVLLTIDQPFGNHNGGTVAFGLDGYLYIGMGDGGSGNDPDNRAQTDSTLLGKMLRLDVSGGLGSGYSIPPSNPDIVGSVPSTWLPETWSKGWRNPYRFSFDRVFGDMYVGDVGQASIEEVSVEAFGDPGGRNYGWRLMEGTSCKIPATDCNDGTLTLPVHEYFHMDGRCSITGGYVYRGSIPEIYGHYFFGDFCTGEVFSFVWNGSEVLQLTDRTAAISPAGGFGHIAAFGEDGFGELYILDIGGKIYRIVSGS